MVDIEFLGNVQKAVPTQWPGEVNLSFWEGFSHHRAGILHAMYVLLAGVKVLHEILLLLVVTNGFLYVVFSFMLFVAMHSCLPIEKMLFLLRHLALVV